MEKFDFWDDYRKFICAFLENEFRKIHSDTVATYEYYMKEYEEGQKQKYLLSLEKEKNEKKLNNQINTLKAIIWEYERITSKRIVANELWDWDWFGDYFAGYDFKIEDIEQNNQEEKEEEKEVDVLIEDIPF